MLKKSWALAFTIAMHPVAPKGALQRIRNEKCWNQSCPAVALTGHKMGTPHIIRDFFRLDASFVFICVTTEPKTDGSFQNIFPFFCHRISLQENNMDVQIEKIRCHVRDVLGTTGSHGMDHTERVTGLCRIIGKCEHADLDILIPAALLHDIARPLEKEKGLPHEMEGARMAEAYLVSINYHPEFIPAISAAIRSHRFRSDEKPATPEAKILSDADKLDALGAVGIARTFMRAAEHGGDINDAVMHFHDKLLKLKDLMFTETGRDIARERHAFLITFLEILEQETGHSNPGNSGIPPEKNPGK
jgi:uncharacterized protein